MRLNELWKYLVFACVAQLAISALSVWIGALIVKAVWL